MNYAERVKELVLELVTAARQHEGYTGKLDQFHTAIDAMQSALDHALESEKEGWRYSKEVAEYLVRLKTALDDAVAKLAALDAEVERLRKDAERYRWLCKALGETQLPTLIERITESYVADYKPSIDAAIDAALSKEVKDDWIEYRGRDDAALSEEVKGGAL